MRRGLEDNVNDTSRIHFNLPSNLRRMTCSRSPSIPLRWINQRLIPRYGFEIYFNNVLVHR